MCEETKRTRPKLGGHTVNELVQIILRKDEVERRSNNTIKELQSQLEESEKKCYKLDLELKSLWRKYQECVNK